MTMNFRVLATLCLGLTALLGGRAAERKNATAERCGVDLKLPAQRVFADPDGKKGWREFKKLQDVPPIGLNAGTSAVVWTGREGGVFVELQEPGEDWYRFTDYCFDQTGQLVQVSFQLRTAWGWGYRSGGPVVRGAVAASAEEFFDLKTETVIAKPADADEVAEARKVDLYLRKSKLPFAKFL